MGTESDFPVIILIQVVRIEFYRCIIIKKIVLIKYIVHCQVYSYRLFFGDRTHCTCFGPYHCFLCIFLRQVILAFIEHQVRFGMKLKRQVFTCRLDSEMHIARQEFLFVVYTIGHKVEIAQTEVAGYI